MPESPYPQRPNKYNSTELSRYLTSNDPYQAIHAINVLLEVTHDHDENYTLHTTEGALVIRGLVICFERCIGWNYHEPLQGEATEEDNSPSIESGDNYEEVPRSKKRRRQTRKTRKPCTGGAPFIDLEQKYQHVMRHAWDWEPLPLQRIPNPDQNNEYVSSTTRNEKYDHDTCEWTQAKLNEWHSFCHAKLQYQPKSQYELPSWADPNRKPSLLLTEAQYKQMEAIIVILRNLSFVAANARHLAYSVGILRILAFGLHTHCSLRQYSTSVLISDAESTGTTNACLHSLQTLITLAPFLPVTGSKLFADMLLLDDSANTTNNDHSLRSTKSSTSRSTTTMPTPPSKSTKLPLAYRLGLGGMLISKRLDTTLRGDEEINTKIPSMLIRTLVWSHILTITSLFPHILKCILQNEHRSIVLSALDLLKELLEFPENRILFQTHIPEALMERLVDLLYIPRSGPDSLEYMDPVKNMITRIPTSKEKQGYDSTIDFELRDAAAELLDRITQLSPDLKRRVGMNYAPRVVDYLTLMLGTSAGRVDARQLAGGVLANIAMIQENKRLGIDYAEERLLNLAARDADVANVVCNSLFN